MVRRVWFPVLLAVLALVAPGTARTAQQAPLAERLEEILGRLGPHPISAVRVQEGVGGNVLYERNGDLSLMPASNQKLYTTAAALERLGPDYRYVTRVVSAAPRDGVVDGDLTLVGGGDPTLDLAGLTRLADGVREAGVRRVTGGVAVDETRYDAERFGAGWEIDDEPYYYAAQITALSWERNSARVTVSPGEAGQAVRVVVAPLEGLFELPDPPPTAPAGERAGLTVGRERATNRLRLTGTLSAGADPVSQSVSLHDPGAAAGRVLARLLRERGLEVGEPAPGVPAGDQELARVESPPLEEIAARINKPSDNLMAEMVFKELGFRFGGEGSARAGSRAVRAALDNLSVPHGGVTLADGSGLSRHNLVTVRSLCALLAAADRRPWAPAFRRSLPVAGVDGTLRSRLRGSALEGKLWAKTGTLSRVSALSGYFRTPKDRELVFSIVINHHFQPASGDETVKRIEDALVLAMAELGG